MALRIGFPPGSPQKQFRVRAWHKRTDSKDEVPLDFRDESDGTQKLFEFTGGWIRALEWGATLFVDELDRRLHPHMTRFLVSSSVAQVIKRTRNSFSLHTTRLYSTRIFFAATRSGLFEKDDDVSLTCLRCLGTSREG